MGDLTKEEIKAMKAKEAKNRKEKLDNSKIHDAEVIEKYKERELKILAEVERIKAMDYSQFTHIPLEFAVEGIR